MNESKFKNGANPKLAVDRGAGLILAIKRGETAQYKRNEILRQKAEKKAVLIRRIKTEEQATENRQAEIKAEKEARIENLYYVSNYFGVHRHIVSNIIKAEEEAEPVGKAEALTAKDFITLYYSNVLVLGGENPREQDPHDKLQENDIIKFLKHLKPLVRLNQRVKTPINQLVRLNYSINEAKTPQALKYLLTFKGKAERATNTQTNEIGKIKPVLSYNFIGYEPNKIVIYGEKATIKAIEKRFNKLNSIEDSFYDFIEEENKQARIIREVEEQEETKTKGRYLRGIRTPKQRKNMLEGLRRGAKRQYYEEADTAKKAELINRALFYEIKINEFKAEVTTKVRGLNNIKEEEKELTKRLREPKTENKEFIEILQDIKQALKATDGRQSLINIEYDLRKDLKDLKREKEYIIFKLYKIIEDSKYLTTEEEEEEDRLNEDLKDLKQENIILKADNPTQTARVIRNSEEIKEIKAELKEIKEQSSKKRTALLNVLLSIKQIIEERKDIKQTIEEELKEAEKGHEFKAQKKSKNKYSTQYGIQRGNGNPQTTHRRVLNKIPLKNLKQEKTEEKKALIGLRNIEYLFFLAQTEIKAERKAEEAKKRYKREAEHRKLIIEDLIFYYGEKAVKQNLKTLLKEHKEDYELKNMFILANEL